MYYMGFTYADAYALPVEYKRWFIERLSKELARGKDAPDDSTPLTRDPAMHTPENRALAGMNRPQVPHKLIRFSLDSVS